MADFVRVFITPIHSDKYGKTINSHKSVQATKSSTDEMNQSSDILSIKEVVKNDKTENLFYITIIAGILSTSKELLLKRQKAFEECRPKCQN